MFLRRFPGPDDFEELTRLGREAGLEALVFLVRLNDTLRAAAGLQHCAAFQRSEDVLPSRRAEGEAPPAGSNPGRGKAGEYALLGNPLERHLPRQRLREGLADDGWGRDVAAQVGHHVQAVRGVAEDPESRLLLRESA